MKFCFATLGCKVNQFETQALAQLAQERGHFIVSSNADVCILNTCTVTESGTKKNIRELRRLKKNNPHAILALCGCFAQTDPARAAALSGVSVVCGISDRASVITQCERAVRQALSEPIVSGMTPSRLFEPLPAGVLSGHTRALLKVQDGCDNYCTYCIIPYARGHVRSLPLDNAISQAQQLAQQGVREIMITGIEIASYGRDLPQRPSLITLIQALCRCAPSVRFRLGSLEPRCITQEFCDTLARYDNLAQHFHLSLQSGCDATLQRMHRRYTTAQYTDAVTRLRTAFPGCSLTTDIITGFPGETEEEFTQTAAFIRQIAFSSVHVFPYSERPGTPAASMPNAVPPAVRTQRAEQLRVVCSALSERFLQGFLNQTISIVLEQPHHGIQSGHSRWHFAVQLEQPVGHPGDEVLVIPERIQNGTLIGKIAT